MFQIMKPLALRRLARRLVNIGIRTQSRGESAPKRHPPQPLAKRIVNSKITGAVQKALVAKKASKGTLGSRTIFKVSKNALLVDKNLLKGQRLLRHFPGFGNFYGTVKRFNLDCNAYTLKFQNGSLKRLRLRMH